MELDELEILQRKACTGDHGVTVTSASVCTCAAEVSSSVSTGREDSLVCAETMEGTILHVESNDADTLAILHDKVEGEVLNEKVCVVAERLAVERVEEGVAGAVSGGSASVCLTTLAELQ